MVWMMRRMTVRTGLDGGRPQRDAMKVHDVLLGVYLVSPLLLHTTLSSPRACLMAPSGHGHPVWHGLRVPPRLQPTRAPRRRQYAGKKGSVSQGRKHDTFGALSGHFRGIFSAIIGTYIALGE